MLLMSHIKYYYPRAKLVELHDLWTISPRLLSNLDDNVTECRAVSTDFSRSFGVARISYIVSQNCGQ